MLHYNKYVRYENIQWLLPCFLLDAARLTGMDYPVLFRKVCCLAVQSKKAKVKKCIHIRGRPLSIAKTARNLFLQNLKLVAKKRDLKTPSLFVVIR